MAYFLVECSKHEVLPAEHDGDGPHAGVTLWLVSHALDGASLLDARNG